MNTDSELFSNWLERAILLVLALLVLCPLGTLWITWRVWWLLACVASGAMDYSRKLESEHSISMPESEMIKALFGNHDQRVLVALWLCASLFEIGLIAVFCITTRLRRMLDHPEQSGTEPRIASGPPKLS